MNSSLPTRSHCLISHVSLSLYGDAKSATGEISYRIQHLHSIHTRDRSRGIGSRCLVLHMETQDDGWFQPLFINNRSVLEFFNSCSHRLDSSSLTRSQEETSIHAIFITILYRSETIKGASPPSRPTLFLSHLKKSICLIVKTT